MEVKKKRALLPKFLTFLKKDPRQAVATGLYVPLYVYPAGDGLEQYGRLVRVRVAHPSVPVTVAINPSSGSGVQMDPNYEAAVSMLQAAGIVVLGYIYTSWGSRSISQALAEIAVYRQWYGADGIMVDEFSTDVQTAAYYKRIRDYARSLGMTFVMGNPGTDVPVQHLGLADNFIIYENAGLPARDWVGGWHEAYPKQNWSCCSYGVPLPDDSRAIKLLSRRLGFIYVTDGGMPNPYSSIPRYLERLVEILDDVADR